MKNLEATPTPTNAGTKRPLSRFARRLWQEWRRLALPLTGERVVVAVSGGADSTSLLLAFDELIKSGRMALALKVAHLDHGLRGDAGAGDARWVEELARELGYEVIVERAAVEQHARESRDNLEQAARRERYDFLGRVARAWEAHSVAVGHTLDDQAETLLLALLRGSGARGLGAMCERRGFQQGRGLHQGGPHQGGVHRVGDELLLVRPLLNWARRAETLQYAQEMLGRGASVCADEMNEDEQFARVRVRRQLLPLLETFNPRVVETLARTAGLLRAEADALEKLGGELLSEACRDAFTQAGARRREGVEARQQASDERDAVGNERDAIADQKAADRDSPSPKEGSPSLNEDSPSLNEDSTLVKEGLSSLKEDSSSLNEGSSSLNESSSSQNEDWQALSVAVLRGADEAVRSYALRGWIAARRGNLRRIESVHIEAVGKLLEGERGGRVAELPGGSRVERRRGLLLFHAAENRDG
jgi:tRNA(Ile)-lysidine synthetase-like protein